jgi:hypothetical protein
MRRRSLLILRTGALFLMWLAVASCEWDPFGPDQREIAGGYRLKKADNSQFALVIPYQTGGMIIDEIGWHQPFIIARGSGSDSWQAINTDHATRILISDEQRKSDPAYRSIQVESAEQAWGTLSRHKRLW